MKPIIDPDCQQKFRINWEFEHDNITVMEGDSFNVTVLNHSSGDPQGGLR